MKKYFPFILFLIAIAILVVLFLKNPLGSNDEILSPRQPDDRSLKVEQALNKMARKIYSEKRSSIEIDLSDQNQNKFVDLYKSCYPLWNLIINDDFFDLVEGDDFPVHKPSIMHCLEGYPELIPSLDPQCLTEYHTLHEVCEMRIFYYTIAVVNFYLENVIQLSDPAQIPQEMLFIRLLYLLFFQTAGEDILERPVYFKKLDSHYNHLTYMPDLESPGSEIVWSFLKELQITNLAMIGLYYKVPRSRWAIEIEQYDLSNDPDPIFALSLKIYVYERFQEYQELDNVINEYIANGNIGGWGYYFLARRLSGEGNFEKSKDYIAKALMIDPDNYAFEYTYQSLQDLDLSDWQPSMFFGSFMDRNRNLLLPVFNSIEPWQTILDEYYE